MDKRCVLAYTSIYVDPLGHVHPCCASDNFENPLKFSDYETIPELLNATQFKELRKSMEDGEPLAVCDTCFKQGHQMKDYWNNKWKHKLDSPDLRDNDFNVKSLQYLDARFSNICNFKCRMCGPGLSSSWYDDYIAIHGKRGQEFLDERIFKHTDPMSKFTPEDLDTVEHLMIGGGEPFITEDFWKLIDSFSNEQKKQISFYGNTNGSVTKFKGQSIMEKVSKFSDVTIGVSVDGYGDIGEYQRTGMKQDRFDRNVKHMIDFMRGKSWMDLMFEFTITTINVFHILDFIIWADNKFPGHAVHFHWARAPHVWACHNATGKFHDDIVKYIRNILTNDTVKKAEVSVKGIEGFLSYMENTEKESYDKEAAYREISILDERRGDSYKDIVPHLENMLKLPKKLLI